MENPAGTQPDLIDIQIDDGIGWLVLNRPDKLNAMNAALLEEFSAALAALSADDAVRVIVIRGAGRCFSTGYDLARSPAATQSGHRPAVAEFTRLKGNITRYQAIWDCPKPVIAAVHGWCLAGATQMCVFCDITVVADDAKIGLPKIPAGGGYITPLWTWLIGPKRAKQMAFTSGSAISGTTAVEWGFANYSVPESELWDSVTALARDIARTPAPVLQMKKHSINRIVDLQGFSSSVGLGAETDALLHMDPSVQQLLAAIRERGLKAAIAAFEAGELA